MDVVVWQYRITHQYGKTLESCVKSHYTVHCVIIAGCSQVNGQTKEEDL